MVAPKADDRRVDSLIRLLNELAEAHQELLGAVEEKIEAMRAADTERIRLTMEREQTLVERIDEREGLRRQLTENLVRPYGVGAAAARRLNVRQLAQRLGTPHADTILAASGRLQELTTRIARRNHVAQLISQNILRHMKHVFSAMTVGRGGAAGYSPEGEACDVGAAKIFDAVG